MSTLNTFKKCTDIDLIPKKENQYIIQKSGKFAFDYSDTERIEVKTEGTVGPPGLTGPVGLVGLPSVLKPGAINIGSLAAGITGTAPDQSLNMTLIKGDTGDSKLYAYLSYSAIVIPAGPTSALASSWVVDVVAYLDSVRLETTVGTITGQVSGLTTTVNNNSTDNTTITVAAATTLSTKDGILTIPVTINDIPYTFYLPWVITRHGVNGANGAAGSNGTIGFNGTPNSSFFRALNSTGPIFNKAGTVNGDRTVSFNGTGQTFNAAHWRIGTSGVRATLTWLGPPAHIQLKYHGFFALAAVNVNMWWYTSRTNSLINIQMSQFTTGNSRHMSNSSATVFLNTNDIIYMNYGQYNTAASYTPTYELLLLIATWFT